MIDAVTLILPLVGGLGLGTLFFGGLWWTLRKALTSERPAVWFACSLLIRLSLVLFGFYLISGGHWQRLLPCLLGFIVARTGSTWLTRPTNSGNRPAPEARHGS